MHCGCGCGEDVKPGNRYIRWHARRNTRHSAEKRAEMSASRSGGRVPVFSPYVPGLLVRFRKDRWVARNPKTGSTIPHARLVWEFWYGEIPEGFQVHHRNGDSTELEYDAPLNLMLLTKEWNCYYMVNLARGFDIPEAEVTEAYLQVEHLPYESRFPLVCGSLARRYLGKISG